MFVPLAMAVIAAVLPTKPENMVAEKNW